jgi:beta-lactamase class C
VPHAYDNLAEEGWEIRDILPEFATVNISAPPGELYGYQNVLFSLFDTIASQVYGKDFSELLHDKLFSPLGMQDASAGFESLVWHPDVAFPHIQRGNRYRALPMHTGYYNLMPAAGINASISDMGRWLMALLGHAPEIVGEEVLEQIRTSQIYTPLRQSYTRHWETIDGRHYSFGWRIYDYKGKRILYHGGYVRGYRAEIAFCPEEDIGLAFLQNSPNGLASRCIPAFFNLLFAGQDGATAPLPRYSGN